MRGGTGKLSAEEKADLKRRGLAGESAASLGREFGVESSTAAYHINRAREKSVLKAPKKRTAKAKFVDIMLEKARPSKVAIIVTDIENIKSTLESLWK